MLRNKSRSFLTIVAIVIGAFTLSLTNATGDGIRSYLERQLGNLGAENSFIITARDTAAEDRSSDLPAKYDPERKRTSQQTAGNGPGGSILMGQKDLTKLQSRKDLVDVRPITNLVVDYVQLGTSDKYTTNVSRAGELNIDLIAGRRVEKASVRPEITLPKSYVEAFKLDSPDQLVGQEVVVQVTNAKGETQLLTASVVGIQEKSLIGSSVTFLSRPAYDQLLTFQQQGLPIATIQQYGGFFAEFDKDLSDAKIDSLIAELKNDGYTANTIKKQSETIFTVVNAVTLVLNGFGIIALLAAGLGIINTLLMSVQERTKEIGLMKALGLGGRTIFTLFSIEAVLLGFWGSLIGILLARGAGELANRVAEKTFLEGIDGLTLLVFPLGSQLMIALGIMVIAFLAGTLPAIRAAKKDPIEALRYE